jgi:diketogulonate reductase-like aldo/keto reductase
VTMTPTIRVNGIDVPRFFYGTAWKEDRTEANVSDALAAGFRAIDTANQRKHYYEEGTGAAIASAIASGLVSREKLFLQTKFTHAEGQDERLPYDPRADYPTQVRQSFANSLEHLGVSSIDSYVLHGPRTRRSLSSSDREVWATMEELQQGKRARLIGVSNVSAEQLATLCRVAVVKPAFVQNRCFAELGWDREVRRVCASEGVTYQGFSLLTANRAVVGSSEVRTIARKYGKTAAQVVFRLALQLGMICLTGTIDPQHMREDLDVFDFELNGEEQRRLESLAG